MSADENLSPAQFRMIEIPATQIQKGDRIGASLKTRVHTVLPRGEHVLVAHKTKGGGGSVSKYGAADRVKVWRKG